ncbi:Uncharacterised protein [Legionella taurinensis]|nr:Uncharacterised protein [Legionella taurinensis]
MLLIECPRNWERPAFFYIPGTYYYLINHYAFVKI